MSRVKRANFPSQHRFVLPPVCAFAAMSLMVCIHIFFPVTRLFPAPLRWIGLFIVVAGYALVIWTIRLFGRAGTTLRPFGKPTSLVVTGPYRWSRNPIYLGLALMQLGLGVLLDSALPFLVIPAFIIIMTRWFIRPEEEILQRAFGEENIAYRSRVRRWL